jgi:predicted flap endonuclease-1-like 5' DNA nuclease
MKKAAATNADPKDHAKDKRTTVTATRSPNDFPARLAKPALRALHGAGIRTLTQLARWSEADLAALHGIGPRALTLLRKALAQRGTSFRAS